MALKWNAEAEKEFQQLSRKAQEKVKQKLEKLPEKGLNWDKVGLVEEEGLDLQAFRIKVAPTDGDVNHRVIFDFQEGDFIVYKVGERPGFYDQKSLEDVKKRI